MNVQPRPIIQVLEIPDAGGGRTFVVTQSVMLVEDDVHGVAVDVAMALALLPWNRGGAGFSVAVADPYDPKPPPRTFAVVTAATPIALSWLAYPYPAGAVDALTSTVRSAIEGAIGDATLKDVGYVVGLADPASDAVTPLPGAPSVTLWQQMHGLANLPGPTCWRLGVTSCFRLTGAGVATKTVIAVRGLIFAGASLPPGPPPAVTAVGAGVYRWHYNAYAYAQVFAAQPGGQNTNLIKDMWVDATCTRDDDWQSKLPARFAATLDLARLLLDTARASLTEGTVAADWGASPAVTLLRVGLRALRLASGTGVVAGIDLLPAASAWVRAGGFGSELTLATLAADGLNSDALGMAPLAPLGPPPVPLVATADTAWLRGLQSIRALPNLPPPGAGFDTVLSWLGEISATLADRAVFSALVQARWRNASAAAYPAAAPAGTSSVPIWMGFIDSRPAGGVVARGLLDLTRFAGDLVLEVSQVSGPGGPFLPVALTIAVCDGEKAVDAPAGRLAAASMIGVTLTLDPRLNRWTVATTSPGWAIANPPSFPAPPTASRNSLTLAINPEAARGTIVFGDSGGLAQRPTLHSTAVPPRHLGSTRVGLLISGTATVRVLSAAITAPTTTTTVPAPRPPSDDSFQPRDKLLEAACAPVFPVLLSNPPATPGGVAEQMTTNAGSAVEKLIELRFPAGFPAGALTAIKTLAMRRATGFLVPPAADPAAAPASQPVRLPLHKAQPVVLPFHIVDPLKAEDFWDHFCGIGVLAQRQDGSGAATGWFSLNAANVAVKGVTAKIPLDPVPLVVGTSNGVTKSELVFDNHPLIAPIAFTEPVDDAPDAPLYRFEHAERPIPSLVFGTTYQFALYAIGPGGVLPPELRGSHPAMLTSPMGIRSVLPVTPPASAILSTPYLRRVSLGQPVIDVRPDVPGADAPAFPAPPSTVQPLARELPAPPDAFYIRRDSKRVMYLTELGGGIDPPPASGGTLRVDLLELDFGAGSVEAANLTMTLRAPHTLATDRGPQLWTFSFNPAAGDTPVVTVAAVGTDEIRIDVAVPPRDALALTLSPAFAAAQGIVAWSRNNLRVVIDPNASTVTVSTLPGAHAFAEATPLPWEQAQDAKTSAPKSMLPPTRAAWLEFASPGSDPNSVVSVVVPDVVVGGQSVADPDRGASGRQIALIAHDGTTKSFRVRPPAMEFQAWLRWIRQDSSRPTIARISAAVEAGANAAASSRASSGEEAARLDDPAVAGIAVRWRDLVPVRNEPGMATRFVAFRNGTRPSQAGLEPDQRSGITISLKAVAGVETSVTMSDETGVTVTMPFDRIVDLDIHAVMYDTQSARFDDGMGGGLWRGALSSNSGVTTAMVAGPPLRLRCEVTDDFEVTAFNAGAWLTIANPASGLGTDPSIPLTELSAVLALTPPTADDDGFERYWMMRRAESVRVISRNWLWDGRPLPSPGMDRTLFSNYGDTNINPFDTAFLGAPQALGWPAAGSLPSGLKPSSLLRKDLDWRGGVPVWQFHARLINRYAALMKPPVPTRLDWTERPLVHVMDRGGPPLPVPRVALVLPLTQALSETATDRPLPPVMVLLEEPWHTNGDVSERLHCAIETVRFDIDPATPPPLAQHWFQQAGPDPILTGRGGAEAVTGGTGRAVAVPLIVHGAAGLSPAPDAAFPDFTATTFLVEMQPPGQGDVLEDWLRWPFLRLRFRRIREPGWLDPSYDNTIDVAGSTIQAVCHDIAVPAAWAGGVTLATEAGTLAIGIARASGAVLTWNTSVIATPAAPPDWGPDWPIDAQFAQPFGAFTLRLVVSPHGRKGGGWDVAMAVGTGDLLAATAQPFLFGPVATIPGDTSPAVTMMRAGPTLATRGVRASDWTSPLWCQFTPDTSRFTVTFADQPTKSFYFYTESLKVVTNPDGSLQIMALHPTSGWQVPISLAPMGGPVTASHAAILLAAVVTQKSASVFGSIVEDLRRSTPDSPLHLVNQAGAIATPAEKLTGHGRLRLLTMVQYAGKTPSALMSALFPSDPGAEVATRIVGISRPFDIL